MTDAKKKVSFDKNETNLRILEFENLKMETKNQKRETRKPSEIPVFTRILVVERIFCGFKGILKKRLMAAKV